MDGYRPVFRAGDRGRVPVVASVRSVSLACAVLASCSLAPDDSGDASDRCPQTYEFGNYGCAVIVGRLIGPDGRAARAPGRPKSEISVSLTQLSAGAAIASYSLVIRDTTGRYQLWATRYFGPSPEGPDTLTVQIQAVWWDSIPPNLREGESLPVLAADSVVHQIRLVPVGARFVPDTVDLRLRPPARSRVISMIAR